MVIGAISLVFVENNGKKAIFTQCWNKGIRESEIGWNHDIVNCDQNIIMQHPKSPYNVSMVGYLTSICHIRYFRWPISEILGLTGVKIVQNGHN